MIQINQIQGSDDFQIAVTLTVAARNDRALVLRVVTIPVPLKVSQGLSAVPFFCLKCADKYRELLQVAESGLRIFVGWNTAWAETQHLCT